jgi:hypothetical protein
MLSETHSHSVFAAAGQDALAMVMSSCILSWERRPKTITLQTSALPHAKTTVHLADAAAIKVDLLFLRLKQRSLTCVRRR